MRSALRQIIMGVFTVGLMMTSQPDDLAAQFSRFASIGTEQHGAELGESLHTVDFNDNGIKDIIAGAPGATVGENGNAGMIYHLETPIDQDTLLTEEMAIIEGDRSNAQLGEEFVIGDFNGNGEYDIAVSMPDYSEQNRGKIAVFFGPFEPGDPVSTENADVWIEGEIQSDDFGGRLAVLPYQGAADGLLVAASETADPDSRSGRVYLFQNLSSQDAWQADEADVMFRNDEGNYFYGNDLDGGEDFTGNGYSDVLISAHRANENGDDSGAIYLFEGPFNEQEYEREDAKVVLAGPSQNTFWGARVKSQGDITGNGLTDFAVATLYDQDGRVAFFEGREDWPEYIEVDSDEYMDQEESTHRVYASSGSNRSSGYAFDFSGDYNLDGSINPLIGAPETNSAAGGISVYRQNGSVKRNIRPNLNDESGFGSQVSNIGNITEVGAEFGVDDFVVSAPGASQGIGAQSYSSGVIYIYEGELLPPEVDMSVSPGTDLFPGDEVELEMSFEEGSRPVEVERLVVRKYEEGELVENDTISFGVEENRVLTESFSYSDDVRINFRYEAFDEIGMRSREGENIHFTEAPGDFELEGHSPDEDVISISGNPFQEVEYEFSASDHPVRDISYRFAFSHEPEGFENGNYETVFSTDLPDTVATYQEINEFMRIHFGIGEEVPVYWNVYATNNVHRTWADNGPFQHLMIREGLDPFFELDSADDDLIIEGREEDTFRFDWDEMVTDNPNDFLQYYFRLMIEDDTGTYLEEFPTGDDATQTHFELTYKELKNILEDHDLLEAAEGDDLEMYYTVRAMINQNEDQSHFPNPQTRQVSVEYRELVGTSADEDEEIPEEFSVKPNYPNPFNNQTQIRFTIPEQTQVNIEVFDVLGQEVYTWSSGGQLMPGEHEHAINAEGWSSGTYIYRVRTDHDVRSRTMMLMR